MLYARRGETQVDCGEGTLVFKPLGGSYGAVVEGIDLSRQASHEQQAALRHALDVYSLLCVPGQTLAPADEVRTVRIFNDISDPSNVDRLNPPGCPGIIILSNIVG